MKKLMALLLVFTMIFGLFACSKNPKGGDDCTKPADTTTQTTVAEKLTELVVKALNTVDLPDEPKKNNVTLSADDAAYISEIIKNAEWCQAGCDGIPDYSFEIDGKTYYYNSECGEINNQANSMYFTLYEADRLYFNSLLGLTELVTDSVGSESIENFWSDFDSDDHLCSHPTFISGTAVNFGLKLLKEAASQEKNALVSPLSVLTALSMTANGARGETQTQMLNVLGGKLGMLNDSIKNFNEEIENHEGVSIANSVWFNNNAGLKVNKNFSNTVKNIYGTELFNENFDRSTLEKINNWISLNTDGTIKDMLKEIPSDAVTYLINTVLFDGEWTEPYFEWQVLENIDFTAEDGSVKKVEMLFSEENMDTYFKIGKVQGFRKEYTNGYSFLGILPDEGVTVDEALESFTAHQLCDVLVPRIVEWAEPYPILKVKLPKFELENSFELSDTLKKMGMPLAFDKSAADFSAMATSAYGNIYIDKVYHNTYISLTEKGTKAGAATVVEFKAEGIPYIPAEVQIIELNFNRPFIYGICAPDGTPLFMGVVRDLGSASADTVAEDYPAVWN